MPAPDRERPVRPGRFWAGWAAIAAAVGLVAGLGPLSRQPALALAALVLAGLVWGGCVRAAVRGGPGWRAIALSSAVLQIVALCGSPRLSDDVYRYAWEGALVADGTSPYAYAPDAPELARFRDEHAQLFDRLEHRDVAAVYPPLVQAGFAGVVTVARALPAGWFQPPAREVLVFRLVFALCALLALWPLKALLEQAGCSETLLLAWGWCPLVPLEFAGAGHFDSLALCLWLGSLALLVRGRAIAGGALLACAALVKVLPVASLPFVLRKRGGGRALAAFAVLGLAAIVFAQSLAGASWRLPGGAAEYGFRWESSSLIYRFIQPLFERHWSLDESATDPRRLARWTVLALWLAFAVWLWLTRVELVRASGALVGAFLVLSPTLHPWYVCWILPFVALDPRASWCWLAAAAPLAYAPLPRWQAEGAWLEPAWLWPALALPFFALRVLESRSPRMRWRSA